MAGWSPGLSFDDAEVYLASVTIGEILAGIELCCDQGSAKADAIERWPDQVCNTVDILTIDGPAFRRWAQLMHRQSDILYEEGMIAAIAKVHRLTVITRKVGNFGKFGVPLLNPFTSRAELGRSADVPLLAQVNGRPEVACDFYRSLG
jgi:predicted nucleic acid-binding protein